MTHITFLPPPGPPLLSTALPGTDPSKFALTWSLPQSEEGAIQIGAPTGSELLSCSSSSGSTASSLDFSHTAGKPPRSDRTADTEEARRLKKKERQQFEEA
uniref:Uncharacterized protein n=1 Tax=Solanum tuberosum TaxID=4113 RepID=M1DB05_SOLTU